MPRMYVITQYPAQLRTKVSSTSARSPLGPAMHGFTALSMLPLVTIRMAMQARVYGSSKDSRISWAIVSDLNLTHFQEQPHRWHPGGGSAGSG